MATTLARGFPPDFQDYLDRLSETGRQESIRNLANIERRERRKHNRFRKNLIRDFGVENDPGPYESISDGLWKSAEKRQTKLQQSGGYALLGLDPDKEPTKRELKNAYRRKARKLHPDVGGDAEAFKAMHTAYRALLNLAKN